MTLFLQADLEKCRERVTTLKAEVTALAEANKRLNEDNDYHKHRLTEVEESCKSWHDGYVSLNTALRALRTERDAYKATDKGLRAQRDESAGALRGMCPDRICQSHSGTDIDGFGHQYHVCPHCGDQTYYKGLSPTLCEKESCPGTIARAALAKVDGDSG